MENNQQLQQPNSSQNSAPSVENDTVEDEEFFDSFPRGVRFCPFDDELINDYLSKKVRGECLPPNRIRPVNLYKKDPSNLTDKYKPINEGEIGWYFFTPRKKKYPNGSRPNRATPNGYWKPTGTDKDILDGSFDANGQPAVIGYKKTLDFYEGKHPGGKKTDWKMHEYKVKDDDDHISQNSVRDKDDMTLDVWVLCKIYKKKKENNENDHEYDEGRPQSTASEEESSSTMLGNNNNINANGEDNNNNNAITSHHQPIMPPPISANNNNNATLIQPPSESSSNLDMCCLLGRQSSFEYNNGFLQGIGDLHPDDFSFFDDHGSAKGI